ncbi:ABC transporter ATP-binding protein [Gordonia sp. L191]|uniref:ABC transporter ATP-binding protein n=1 Tax=Gordonia sp. L191 TaxID=2982699 RepID=UPI0024C02B06|nr:ABC transporter ATP-binding protein [Gordonia sp. L191]WHU46104.1 ABC transporter ATP-binding protein [Gordonia sp. L191]
MTAIIDAASATRTTQSTEIAGQVSAATFAYGDAEPVLRNVSLTVRTGEIVAIIGRSGSGKSTLLRLLAGLSQPSTGDVTTSGAPAVAFQEPRLFPWRTVRRNVEFGVVRSRLKGAAAAARVSDTLAEVGLADKADAWPAQLSGGQAQRVSLARALVADPQLLLLDEPFGALDALTRAAMHRLLINLWQVHGFSVLVVTHDVDEALRLADRVVVLADGHIAADVTVDAPRDPDGAAQTAHLRTRLLDALGE